ncbi:MAG: hypothetical protein IPO83_18330 [Chitinophagaceae bacterium]|nr:hypothetical protein [Chitinophagaceae bacterium]
MHSYSKPQKGNYINYQGRMCQLQEIIPSGTTKPSKYTFKVIWGAINPPELFDVYTSSLIPYDVQGIPLDEIWLGRTGAFIGNAEILKEMPNGNHARFFRVTEGYEANPGTSDWSHLKFVHEYQNWWKENTNEDVIFKES